MLASGNGTPEVCAANLLALRRGEVPYERVKGLDPDVIDSPITERDVVQYEAYRLLSDYEPRIDPDAVSVSVLDGPNGRIVVDIES